MALFPAIRPLLFAAAAAAAAASAFAQTPPSFSETRFEVGGKMDGWVAEDFDGDGRRDLLLLSERRLVLFLQGEKGFARWPTQVMELDDDAMILDTCRIAGAASRDVAFVGPSGLFAYRWSGKGWKTEPEALVGCETFIRSGGGAPLLRDFFADLDGDGLDDVVLPAHGRYVVLKQAKDGTLATRGELSVRPQTEIAPPTRGQLGALHCITRLPMPFVGDFDGDSRQDVVVRTGDRLSVFLGREDGSLPGKPDAVVDTGLSLARKNFGGRASLAFESPMLIEDLGGDGVLDLVACLPLKGEALVMSRAGGLGAGKPTFVFRMDGWPLAAMLKDLDGKNGPDLIVGGVDRIGLWSVIKVFLTREVNVHSFFFLNRGKGEFAQEPDKTWDVTIPLKFATTAKGFRIGTSLALDFSGDFDGDGRRDLVSRRGDVQLDVFRGSSDGVFEQRPWTSLTIRSAEPYRYIFPETFDFNGDGVSDILVHYRDWSEQRDMAVLYASVKG